MDTPIVVLPFVSSALAGRVAFRRSVETLCSDGVHILLDPGGFEAHPRRTGGSRTEAFPWHFALDEAGCLLDAGIKSHSAPGAIKGSDQNCLPVRQAGMRFYLLERLSPNRLPG